MNEINRFTFFKGYADSMKLLNDAESGQLIKGMSRFIFEGIEPQFKSQKLQLLWPAIKPNLETNAKNIKHKKT